MRLHEKCIRFLDVVYVNMLREPMSIMQDSKSAFCEEEIAVSGEHVEIVGLNGCST